MVQRNTITPAQRVQAAVSNINKPISCEKCGSVFFLQIPAAMFTPSANSFRNVSAGSQNVFLCVCGELQTPTGYNAGIPAGSERDMFAQSLKAAIDYRASVDLNQVAQGVVGVAEYNRLVAKVDELIHLVNESGIGAGEGSVLGDMINESLNPPAQEEAQVQDVLASEPNEPMLVGTGIRGRSAAAAEASNSDNTKHLNTAGRPFAPGGARARMARQGGQ